MTREEPCQETTITSPILAELDGEQLLLRSPNASTEIRMHVSDFARLATTCREVSSETKTTLLEQGWLTPATTKSTYPGSRLPPPWDKWGVIAWAFHDFTAKVRFVSRAQPDQVTRWLDDLRRTPTPSTTHLERLKRQEEIIPLPRQPLRTGFRFERVLHHRRTVRDFTNRPLPLTVVGHILRAGFGPVDFVQSGELGHMELRPALSGGAIHESSAIVVARAVEGLPPGSYVYDQIRHGLVPVRQAEMNYDDLEALTADQGSTKNTAFSILSFSDAARLSWKYQDARAYRILLMNAGCIAQVVSMVAYSLGVGAAVTAALDEARVAQQFGLEQYREIPMFLFSIGTPAAEERFDPGPLEPRRIGGLALRDRRGLE